MKYMRSVVVCLALSVLAFAQPGFGQTVTTGNIAGTVLDQFGDFDGRETVLYVRGIPFPSIEFNWSHCGQPRPKRRDPWRNPC